MSDWLLDKEEAKQAWDTGYSEASIEGRVQIDGARQAIAKAQAKKLVEWLEEHYPDGMGGVAVWGEDEDWQAIKKEVLKEKPPFSAGFVDE